MTVNQFSAFTENGSEAPEQAAALLKMLGHRDRLRILCELLEGELTVAAIETRVGASQSAISQHLARMKDEGILKCRRDGRKVLYEISDPVVHELMKLLYQRYCALA